MVYDPKLSQTAELRDLQNVLALGEHQKARQIEMKTEFNSSFQNFEFFSYQKSINYNFLWLS